MKFKLILTILILSLIATAGTYFFHLKDSAQTKVAAGNAPSSQSGDVIEIFSLPHPPAQAIVEKVETVLAQYPKFSIVKYDLTDPNNETKIQAYGLIDHTPIAIFINGVNTFTIEDKTITLLNFPQGDAFVPTLEGSWNYDDLAQILAQNK